MKNSSSWANKVGVKITGDKTYATHSRMMDDGWFQCLTMLYMQCSRQLSSTVWATHLQLGGDLSLRTTVIAWKRQDWVIVPTVRPLSPASVMTPTTNFSSGWPATVSTYYIGCCQLNESSTTVYASAATTTSCSSELLCWKTKTSSLECCINLEIDCHNTPLTFISRCKLDSVLPVILIKFYVMLCCAIGLYAEESERRVSIFDNQASLYTCQSSWFDVHGSSQVKRWLDV